MKELFDLIVRLVTAVEKIAANGGGGFVAAAEPTKLKKEKAEKAEKADKSADPKPEPAPKKDPFGDDDETAATAAPQRTKEEVRKVLTEYATATNNDTALAALAKVTSNKAGRVPDIKPEEYNVVYDAIAKLLADTKK